MATFATLPGDLLTAIASYVDTPHFVVAVAADGDARAAVRRGVDEAERALRGMSMADVEVAASRTIFFSAGEDLDRRRRASFVLGLPGTARYRGTLRVQGRFAGLRGLGRTVAFMVLVGRRLFFPVSAVQARRAV